jgi:hypothetical protein
LYANKLILALAITASICLPTSAECIGHQDPNDPTFQQFKKAAQNKSLTDTDWQFSNGIRFSYVEKGGHLFGHIIAIPVTALTKIKDRTMAFKLATAYGKLKAGQLDDFPVNICAEGNELSISVLGGDKAKVVPTQNGLNFVLSGSSEPFDAVRVPKTVQ